MSNTRPWWLNPRWLLLAIIVFAAGVRLANIEWDQNHHFHPDERAVAFAVQRLSLQPLQLDPDFFNYGSLPIYLAKLTSAFVGLADPHATGYDGVITNGRRLSALFGTLTVLLTFMLGARLYDRSVGLLAALLLGATVLHIQNSRFMTVDIPLTLFVLLALLQLVRVSAEGRTLNFVLAGICIGLAMATKFSAAPLFLPLAVAGLHRCVVERRFFAVAGRVVLAVVAAGLAFAITEPYAILRFDRFYRDILEQSHMVRNAGVFPYTTQYVGTPKYLYDIEQMVIWGMAPALGIVAVWATIVRMGKAFTERRGDEWVLLSWVVPFFLVTGWFEVKFPRYLLPIYPMLIVWASEWLLRKYRAGSWVGRIGTPVVVAVTLLAAFAFSSLYTRPHTVLTASEWFYSHVPPGSRVLSQDWDEGFPFPLPGKNPSQYKVVNFGYYERPDSSAKIQKLANELAAADYIVFQTKRLYGAVTRSPEQFPLTSHYFYQLFAGDLGYELIHEVAARPSLFGFEIPDEIGDESLSVYDHPKVLVFKNTGKLDAATLADKILRKLPPSKPLTRTDLLLASPSAEGGFITAGRAPPIDSSLYAVMLWVVVVQILSLAVYPVLRIWFTGVGTLALSKVLGVLLFAYVSWLLVSLGVARFTQGSLAVLLAAFVLVGGLAWRREGRVPMRRAEIIGTEALIWGVFAFFLIVRMYNPEVFWGEKPMDFSFLNAITRSTGMPPPEPWFAGSPLYYSYFGYYVVAALGKMLHIHPALTFNLGIASMAALTAAAAFAAGATVGHKWQTGALAVGFITIIGNLAGVRELYARRMVNFDYFWATSRVIRDTINEFPAWSFLFADLHAHVMVMPVSLSFMCLAVLWVRTRILSPHAHHARGTTAVLLLLLCFLLGTITVTNAWSTPTYVLLLLFLLGTIWLTEGQHRGVLRLIWGTLTQVLLPVLLVGGGAYLLYWPFWANFVPPERNYGWERGILAMPRDFLTIWGIFLFIVVPFLYALWARTLREDGKRLTLGRVLVLLLGIAVPLSALFVSTRAFLVVLFLLALQVLLAHDTDRRWRITVALMAFAFAVTAGCDLVFVWDRMNTIFKFYLEAWFMLGTASAVAAHALWTGAVPLPRLRPVWQAVVALLVAVGLFTAGSGAYAVIKTNRVRTPKPTLDGMAYLELRAPDELAAFDWLNANVQGIPVILEAHGDSYQDFTRVSMNTGLPTVLGWGYHVFQRAHAWPDINRRKADIATVYTSDSKDQVAAILQRYHVALVYVGGLERRTYAGGNLERFTEWSDLMTPVYQNPGVTIFAVNGQFAGSMPVTTIEAIPSVAGEEVQPQDAPGRVQQPRGVAASAEGEVLVADFGNHRIQLFGPDLTFVRAFGTRGDLPGQFKEPGDVAVGPSGEIFVADTWNHRVQVFNKEGKYLREWAAGFYGPRGIGVDAQGHVYVVDTGNNRIVRFSSAGQKELEWGKKGSGPGEFIEPVGLATDAAGNVYIADNGNGRLQIFTADGRFVGEFPVSGWESKVYSEPHVAIDDKGVIWVSVPGAKEIRAYDRSGKLLRTITGQQIAGAFFDTPMGIALNKSKHELVVADLEHKIVRIPNVN
jgi:YYY domain-containing protein